MLLFRLLTYPFPFRSKCPQTFLHCFLICAQLLCDSSLLFPFSVLYQLKVWSLCLQSLSDCISCIPASWIPDISLFLSSLHFFTFHNASFFSLTDYNFKFPWTSSRETSMGLTSWLTCALSVFNPNPLLGFAVHCGCKDLPTFLLANC